MKPLVSVIIPAYNVAPYIYHCLSSVSSQTYESIEIIVVNDGSTDDTYSICIGFTSVDDRLKIVNQKNFGLVAARKAGLSVASGELILNVDGDDWLPSNAISLLVAASMSHQSDLVIGSFNREFIGSLSLNTPRLSPGYYSRAEIHEHILPRMIYDFGISTHGITTYSWGKLFRADLYRQILANVPDSFSLGEDSLCTYPFIACCSGLQVIHESVYFYRQRSSSMLKSALDPASEMNYLAAFVRQLQFSLSQVSSFDFSSQIRGYYLRLASERTALCFHGDSIDPRLIGNCKIDKSAKIGVFSSGTFGRRLYTNLPSYGYNIRYIFDNDYHESALGRLEVLPPRSIANSEIEYLLVAAWSNDSISEALMSIKNNAKPPHPFILSSISRLTPYFASQLFNEFFLASHE